jgi:hypothetical protein
MLGSLAGDLIRPQHYPQTTGPAVPSAGLCLYAPIRKFGLRGLKLLKDFLGQVIYHLRIE